MARKKIKGWIPSNSEWDSTWSQCPYSTFFQSREWAEIWSEYTKKKSIPYPVKLELADGTRVILPFSKEKIYKNLASRIISSPGGTFGGWLSDVSLNESQQELVFCFISQHYRDFIWRSNPYEKMNDIWKPFFVGEDDTLVVNLSVGFEEIFRSWTKGHISAVRKADREGVVIFQADTTEDWGNYFRVYEESLVRWGENRTQSYTWDLFETIMLRKSPNIRLWLAKFNGLIIAGALCFYSPTHVVYWHGAALSSHFSLRPVNLLLHEIIRDAADRGYIWFDFNPSGNLKGVKAFKKSFGSLPKNCNIYFSQSTKVRFLACISKKVNRKG